jgi:hypothetical protein
MTPPERSPSDAATVDVGSQGGGKVTEDGYDTVPGVRIDVVCGKIRVHRRDRHPALRREPFGLLEPDA